MSNKKIIKPKTEKNFFLKIKSKFFQFWEKYESNLILIAGLVLVAVLSFEAGILKGQKLVSEPLIIEKSASEKLAKNIPVKEESASVASTKPNNAKQEKEQIPLNMNACLYVGSKNSNKYYKPTCSWAKKIKPNNLVCFQNKEEAEQKGYVYSSCGE